MWSFILMKWIILSWDEREIMLSIYRRNIIISIHRMSEWSASGGCGGAAGAAKWNKIERKKQQQPRSRLQPNTNRFANDFNHKINEFLLFLRSIRAAAKLHSVWLMPSKCAVITSRCATLEPQMPRKKEAAVEANLILIEFLLAIMGRLHKQLSLFTVLLVLI